jgi:hypothetical protein
MVNQGSIPWAQLFKLKSSAVLYGGVQTSLVLLGRVKYRCRVAHSEVRVFGGNYYNDVKSCEER